MIANGLVLSIKTTEIWWSQIKQFYDMQGILYYSFLVGPPFSPMSTWKMVDLKIPAKNPKMAICLHSFIVHWVDEKKNKYASRSVKETHVNPNGGMVWYYCRQVIEYEKLDLPELGFTKHRYKKLRVYSQHQIMSLFDK